MESQKNKKEGGKPSQKNGKARDGADRIDAVFAGGKKTDGIAVFRAVLKESENIMKSFYKETIQDYFKYLKAELPGILLDDYRRIEEAFNPDVLGRTMD